MVSPVKVLSIITALAASVLAAPSAEPFKYPSDGFHRGKSFALKPGDIDVALDAEARDLASRGLAKRSVGVQSSCPGGPLYAGYFRTWRDVAGKPGNPPVKMSDMPVGTNIALVFGNPDDAGFWPVLRDSYVPALHAKGMKVIRSIFIDDILALTPPADGNYVPLAQALYQDKVAQWGLDGLDIDMEKSLTTAQVTLAAGVIQALSKIIGRSGTQPGSLLIYDTNQYVHTLAQKIAPYVDYVLLQAYGTTTSVLQSAWNGYAPYYSSCQFLVGVSFWEEFASYDWGDTHSPFITSNAANFARWNPTGGKKGGMFTYAIDRDWKAVGDNTLTVPTYEYSNQLIPLNKASST